MKLSEIKSLEETTRIIGSFSEDNAKRYIDYLNEQGEYIADWDGKKIVSINANGYDYYGIKDTLDSPVGSFLVGKNIILNNTPFFEMSVIYTIPQNRGKHDMQRLLHFIKNTQNVHILGGDILYDAGISFYNAISKSDGFVAYWYNFNTNEQRPFEINDEYIKTHKPTDWRFVIEGMDERSFPLFEDVYDEGTPPPKLSLRFYIDGKDINGNDVDWSFDNFSYGELHETN